MALGSSRAELGDLPAAEKHYQAALARRPNDPYVLLQMGRVYQKAGVAAPAVDATLRALAARPAYVDALVQAAVFLPAAGRISEVDPLFRKGMLAEPLDPRIPGRYGEWLLAQGRAAEAIPALRRAVELQRRSRGYRLNLGFALLAIGRPAEAAEVFQSVLDDDPGNEEALQGLQSCTPK